MSRRISPSQGGRTSEALAAIATLSLFAGATLLQESPGKRRLLAAEGRIGVPRLIAYEPLPSVEGEMCQWEPASAELPLRAALQQERLVARPADEAAVAEVAKRKPLRVIRDPYAAYSAVAVDTQNNEVVLTDENLFSLLVYDRLANTPPAASMTEPKRSLGGLKTKIEFQCGLYIDPMNGDIYAVNNDTVDTLVIFNRQAKGDVPPTRELFTPHGTFGIAVNEAAQELYLTIQHDNAVVVFPKMAQKDDAPIRLLQGDKTLLQDPHGIALDTKNNLIYVTNHGSFHQARPEIQNGADRSLGRRQGKSNWPLSLDNAVPGSGKIFPPSISVYAKDANGDTAPVRVIEGPKTQMNWPTGIAIDMARNEIFVANDGGDSILVFSPSATRALAPPPPP